MPSSYKIYPVPKFGGGLNTAVHPTQISDDECQRADNIDFNFGGIPKKRYGYAQLGDTIHATNPGTCIDTYTLNTGTEVLLAGVGTQIYKYDSSDGSWDSISATLTVTTRVSSATYQNRWYFTNGTDNYQYYDNSSVTALASAPKGLYLAVHEERAFVAGVSANPSRLYYSVVGDAADFAGTGAGFIDVAKNDGTVIRGLQVAEGVLTVGKYTKGIYRVDFDSTGAPIVTPTPYTPGPVSHFAMAKVNNSMIYFAYNEIAQLSRIPDFPDELRGSKISTKIQPTIEALTGVDDSAAIFHKSKWYLTCRSSGSQNDTIYVFDSTTAAWSKYTNWRVRDWTIYDNTLTFVASDSGKIYQQSTGYSDPGSTTINAVWYSKEFDFSWDNPLLRAYNKFANFMEVEAKLDPDTQLLFELYADVQNLLRTDAISSSAIAISDTSIYSWGDASWGEFSWGGAEGGVNTAAQYVRYRAWIPGGRGKTFSIKLSNNQLDKSFELLSMSWSHKRATLQNYDTNKII